MADRMVPRTVVEFVDNRPDAYVHSTQVIRINGTEVAILDGWKINAGRGEPTTIEMSVVATEIHFVHEKEEA